VTIVCQLALSSVWLWGPSSGEPYLCRAQNVNVGLVYALTASRLIMAHMCKEPFTPPMALIGLMAFGAANSRLRLLDPLAVTLALDAIALLAYLHYVLSVISQICGFLGIRCLSLARPQGASDGADAAADADGAAAGAAGGKAE
jgi:hypothetical protein